MLTGAKHARSMSLTSLQYTIYYPNLAWPQQVTLTRAEEFFRMLCRDGDQHIRAPVLPNLAEWDNFTYVYWG